MTPSPAKNRLLADLFRGTSYLTVVFFVRSLVAVAIMAMLARMLPLETLGTYFIMLQVAELASLLGRLGIAQGSQKFIAVARVHTPGRVRSVTIRLVAISLVGALVTVGIVFLCWPYISTTVFDAPGLAAFGLIQLGMIVILVVERVLSAVLRALDALFLSAITENFLRQFFLLVAVGFMWAFSSETPSLRLILLLWAGSGLAGCLLAAYWTRRELAPFRKLRDDSGTPGPGTGEILRVSLPLGLAMITANMGGSASLLIVGSLLGAEAAGFFGPLQRVAGLFVAALPMNKILMPIAAVLHRDDTREALEEICRKGATLIFVLTLIGWLCVALAGKMGLRLAFGEEFTAVYGVMLILTAGPLARSFFAAGGPVLQMSGHQNLVLAVNTLALVIMVGGMYALSGPFGLAGVAWASTVSMILQYPLLALQAYRHNGIKVYPSLRYAALLRNPKQFLKQ